MPIIHRIRTWFGGLDPGAKVVVACLSAVLGLFLICCCGGGVLAAVGSGLQPSPSSPTRLPSPVPSLSTPESSPSAEISYSPSSPQPPASQSAAITNPLTGVPNVPDAPAVQVPQPAPPAATKTTPVPPPPAQEVYYANCSAAKAAGAAPLYRGNPGYRPALDRDGDGIACET